MQCRDSQPPVHNYNLLASIMHFRPIYSGKYYLGKCQKREMGLGWAGGPKMSVVTSDNFFLFVGLWSKIDSVVLYCC